MLPMKFLNCILSTCVRSLQRLSFRKKFKNHSKLQDNFGVGIAAVEAAKKKHEAIQTDIKAYESRVKTVVDMANTLENEQYWGIDRIKEDLDKVQTTGHNFVFYRTILILRLVA